MIGPNFEPRNTRKPHQKDSEIKSEGNVNTAHRCSGDPIEENVPKAIQLGKSDRLLKDLSCGTLTEIAAILFRHPSAWDGPSSRTWPK